MAAFQHNDPSSAQQPGLRSFIVYDRLPEGCVAFEVPDNKSLPHLRAGDFVVIDPNDCEPAMGELFAITWKSSCDGQWQIAQTDHWPIPGRPDLDGERWGVGAVAAQDLMSVCGTPMGRPLRWTDGPYRAQYVREICHGKVVGIYEPDFRPKLAARA